MLRSILAVLAGFLTWTVLWLTSNAAIAAALPDAFRADGSTDSAGILLVILLLSVVFSLIAGYVAAIVARRAIMKHALALGLLQLAVGLFVQIQYWNLMPLWYHLSFLALLLPGILVGARLRLARAPSLDLSAASAG